MGISHVKVAVGTPRANGQVERENRNVLNAVRCMVQNNDKSWDKHLRMIQWGLNTLINDSTKVSPHMLLFTYNPRDIMQNQLLMMFTAEIPNTDTDALKQAVSSRIKKRQQQQNDYFDKMRRPARKYFEGVQLKQKKTSTIFAADRMKPWAVNASVEDSDEDYQSSDDLDT
ncbi:uncharacterized protein LOC134222762 [Armigeres subalbatus]|uniref:uncharacterized protein LOC134222762 n=1 Tax=Armigeres subalbatus TaxID=124917 RepID=UPI002ED0F44A